MIDYILSIAQIYILFLMLRKLNVISEDTQKKEDLLKALEKFGDIVVKEKNKKIVSFQAEEKKE
jgi:hypothetical protein